MTIQISENGRSQPLEQPSIFMNMKDGKEHLVLMGTDIHRLREDANMLASITGSELHDKLDAGV